MKNELNQNSTSQYDTCVFVIEMRSLLLQAVGGEEDSGT